MSRTVFVHHDVFYVEHWDRESPWGTTYSLNPSVKDWLDERIGDPRWDYENFSEIKAKEVVYGVSVILNCNDRLARLFAATYGMDR